jgi:hypothetical protein
MLKILPCIFGLLILITSTFCSAYGQDATAPNIFSEPQSENENIPVFSDNKKRAAKKRLNDTLGSNIDKIPNWQQVKMIPSLSGQQKRQLNVLYKQSREELKPLLDELKAMKTQNSQGITPGQNIDFRNKAIDIREQIVSSRQKLWSNVSNILTDKQIKELDQMKQGTLTPATFNDQSPTAANMMKKRRRFIQ